MLSKGCKPDNFESHNCWKLRPFRPSCKFVECESFLESNSPDSLVLCKTNLDDSIDSGNFSLRGYVPLILKDSILHVLAVYLKERLPFTQDLFLKNSADSVYVFNFFFLYRWPSSSLCMVFYSVLTNLDEVLSINPTANVFVFNVHHKDWLTYFDELCYNFSISNDLTQMVKCSSQIPDCDSHSPALLYLFLSSDASIISRIAFPPLGNSDHVVDSVWLFIKFKMVSLILPHSLTVLWLIVMVFFIIWEILGNC